MTQESQWLTDRYWLSPYNYADEVRQQFTLPERVYFHEVTIREAVQTPHVSFRGDEKIRIAQALDELGVDSIETGPYISSEDKEVTKELTKMQHNGELKAKVTPLAHSTEADIDLALECGADRVIISQNANPWTVKQLFDIDEDELIERLTRVTSYAKKNGLFTAVMAYDTYRAPLEFLERLHKSLVYEGGADHIVISDTFGFALPWTVTYLVRKVKSWIPGIPIEHHGHNRYGLATAMMIAAVVGGAEVVHTSINAIGEATGNAATEEVAMGIQLLLGVKTGINLDRIYSVCELVSELSKIPIPRNKPVVGENEFTCGTGMIFWAMQKLANTERPFCLQSFPPELIGRKEGYKVILGQGCGRAIVRDKLEKMGFSATNEQLMEIAQRVESDVVMPKWSVPDFAFEDIVREVLSK